ncbi:MAG: hypothetical protein QFX32_00035 [Methanolinea sp.]|nr:hypothetical protein [Methanolinea sp.]
MRYSWQLKLGALLLFLSFLVYLVKFLVLGDPENTYFYVFNALGFLPVNVLLVTVVLNELLSVRARNERMEKLNMVIGTYFSEAGTDLLGVMVRRDPEIDRIAHSLVVRDGWDDRDFGRVRGIFSAHTFATELGRDDFASLRAFLREKRNFLLRLLENPLLLEHQSFTALLRAVFHLAEELDRRGDLGAIPESDLLHLRKDAQRVYRLSCGEWLSYMRHLKESYPYLFSLAVRTNPFDRNARVVVGGE